MELTMTEFNRVALQNLLDRQNAAAKIDKQIVELEERIARLVLERELLSLPTLSNGIDELSTQEDSVELENLDLADLDFDALI
ncbi:MAG: hypothetical protein ACRDBG_25370 [Waterburya sp.]